MHHAVTIRAKQHEVFEPSFGSGNKGMHRSDVMRFDETCTPTTIGVFEIKRTCFALKTTMQLEGRRLLLLDQFTAAFTASVQAGENSPFLSLVKFLILLV